MTKHALVTGATGLLGGYVVERLAAEGWSVRGLVRDRSSGASVEALGARPVLGDVTRPESLRAAAAGCDAIVHAAAAIGPGPDGAAFRLVNVGGTENVVAAAEAAGSRLVHVSSVSVFGCARYPGAPTDEASPWTPLPAWDGYGRSKQAAEQVVLAAHAAGRIWATIVRPPMMYGKRDRQVVPRLAPVFTWGVFPLVGGGENTLALVHAHAVADGIARALQTPAAGGRVYHLTDDFALTVADLVRYASLGLRRRVRTLHVPLAAGRLGFVGLGAVLRIGGRPDLAPYATSVFEMLTRDNPFTSARARRELGWSPTLRPAEGIPEAFGASRYARRPPPRRSAAARRPPSPR